MKDVVIFFVPISEDVIKQPPWDTMDLGVLFEELVVVHRRAIKDVNVVNENARHVIIDSTIENAFMSMTSIKKYIQTKAMQFKLYEYICLIEMICAQYTEESNACFVGSTFLHRDKVQAQYDLLRKFERSVSTEDLAKNSFNLGILLRDRIAYLKEIADHNQHSFDIPIMLRGDNEVQCSVYDVFNSDYEGCDMSFESQQAFDVLSQDVRSINNVQSERYTDTRGKNLMQVARDKISNCIVGENNINLSDYPDRIITQMLYELVYSTTHKMANDIPILYSDGSFAEPFPVGLLKPKKQSGFLGEVMHIGMISERHTSLDDIVSMYWFLNIEVSGRGQTSAEIDNFCYKRSKEMLESVYQVGKDLRIYFYQTGFPFAVIGFYRALAEALAEQKNGALQCKIQVVPMFFCGDDKPYEEGKIWQ